ncbi:putative stress-induced protein KIN1/KIN2 [Helianthus annuus]|uniref:Stress-induced protein KIN1/KIN2 n=2 Tax=Helianthus annuus TaxID=4232 RepID=A0A251TYQ1_HELAN|nr:putative stress-induced protein KIN1/KIN2 [Helianthus annuus]KAJ0526879.1 putative stress-induced protein KIN1/KIN2 [Helianthus annuus]KAJ0535430.1 putative stress-induced protein KIN1/KIN2 [Helianthus annuus]KAJ0543274.1 putative stress-induced protein KIN1/KIN2 [Helianthus annuus]KAJ0708330.1 putative stress-induced protein KIN1/KIN2 [Helianthus annuus]
MEFLSVYFILKTPYKYDTLHSNFSLTQSHSSWVRFLCVYINKHQYRPSHEKMNNQQSASYKAGQIEAQAEEKGNQMMDKASNAAQSAKESVQQAGQQMQEKAQQATEAVKDATGMNK